MADHRTLKQGIHDSQVKWDMLMRAHAWGESEKVDKASVLWWLKQKAAGHEAMIDHFRNEYRWWHWLLGVKKPERITRFRHMLGAEWGPGWGEESPKA